MLDGMDTATRTTLLVIVLTIALIAIVVIAETRRHGPRPDESQSWVIPVATGLTVAIGALVLQRLLPIFAL